MKKKTRKEELRDLLKKLNEGGDNDKVKEEAKELIKNIDPKELSEAEQELINEGLPETELRHLCSAHLEAVAGELEALKTEVPVGHPLYTLIAEHDKILNVLERLEKVNEDIQKLDSYQGDNPLFAELKDISFNLIETEKHHEREENALFPEVDKKGITGPTRIMKMEHEDLWPKKEKIEQLANQVGEMDFEEFKKQLNENVQFLVLTQVCHRKCKKS